MLRPESGRSSHLAFYRSSARRRLATALAGLLWLAAVPAVAQTFETRAEHALLMDAETETVLFQKAADVRMPPASMAKLMTVAVVFDAIKTGQLSLDTEFAGHRERLAQRRRQFRRLDHVRQARLDRSRSPIFCAASSSSRPTTAASSSPRAWPAPRRPLPT